MKAPIHWKHFVLSLLLAVGLLGSGWVSWKHAFTDQACPVLGGSIPACFIVLGCFLFMAMGFWIGKPKMQRIWASLFWAGLLVATGLAVLASILELFKGHVCPQLFGRVPMCYLSLAACISIASLYLSGRRQDDQPNPT